MKSLLLCLVALAVVLSEVYPLHETHDVTISSGQAGVFQILTPQSLPFASLLNDNVTFYIVDDLSEDVVLCANNFFGLPPVGTYSPASCEVYLEFAGKPKPTSTHQTTQATTTQDSHTSTHDSTTEATTTQDSHTSTSESTTEATSTSESSTESTSTSESSTESTSESSTESTSESSTESTSESSTESTSESSTESTTSTTESTTEATTTSTTESSTSHTSSTESSTSHTSSTESSTSQTSTSESSSSSSESSSSTSESQGYFKRFFRYVRDEQAQKKPLRSDLYYVGVYFKNTAAKEKLSFKIGINTTYCQNRFFGANCDQPIVPLTEIHHNILINKTEAYFSLTVPASTPAKAVQSFSVSFASANFVNIYASALTIPTQYSSDSGYANNTVNVTLPRAGTWFFTVTAGEDGNNASVTNQTQTVQVPNVVDGAKMDGGYKEDNIKSGTPKYFSYAVNASQGLSVTVNSQADVTLYAGFNRIPQVVGGVVVGYDVSGCNIYNCSQYAAAHIKGLRLSSNGKNGTWYVTLASNTAEEKKYMLWFQYDCAVNCSYPNGNCHTEPSNFGTCTCGGNFEGLTCAEDNMLIEYIILIIIAALVLVSALLGLIAWAYMRRRSQYVEVK